MKDLLEYIVKSIIDKPEEIEIEESKQNGEVLFTLKVPADQMGRVIGKNGRIIQAIRTLLRVVAIRTGKRVNLKVLEGGFEEKEKSETIQKD